MGMGFVCVVSLLGRGWCLGVVGIMCHYRPSPVFVEKLKDIMATIFFVVVMGLLAFGLMFLCAWILDLRIGN